MGQLGCLFKTLPNFAGAYHTGVEVNGIEYNYGVAGTWTCHRGSAGAGGGAVRGAILKESMVIGHTTMSETEVKQVFAKYTQDWEGCYDQLGRNCNDFSENFARDLTGNQIPDWVNRLARVGTSASHLVGAGPSGRFSRDDMRISGKTSGPAAAPLSPASPAGGDSGYFVPQCDRSVCDSGQVSMSGNATVNRTAALAAGHGRSRSYCF